MPRSEHPDEAEAAKRIGQLDARVTAAESALAAAQRSARRWEHEAIMRASTVAGALTTELLAARRLACAVRRVVDGSASLEDLRAALKFFDKVGRDDATQRSS